MSLSYPVRGFTIVMKMMMLMMTRANVKTFQILMANSTKILCGDNFLSTQLNKLLYLIAALESFNKRGVMLKGKVKQNMFEIFFY